MSTFGDSTSHHKCVRSCDLDSEQREDVETYRSSALASDAFYTKHDDYVYHGEY